MSSLFQKKMPSKLLFHFPELNPSVSLRVIWSQSRTFEHENIPLMFALCRRLKLDWNERDQNTFEVVLYEVFGTYNLVIIPRWSTWSRQNCLFVISNHPLMPILRWFLCLKNYFLNQAAFGSYSANSFNWNRFRQCYNFQVTLTETAY